jgi:hypothetical protein
VFRGATGALTTKWAAGTAAVVVAGVATAALVAIVMSQSTDEPTGASATPPAVSPTLADPSSGPVSPATPTNLAVLATHDGLPVYELVAQSSTVALPGDAVLYFTDECAVCDGGELFRLRQDQGGAWVREPLLAAADATLPAGQPIGEWVSDDHGRFGVLWCLSEFGVCGKRHDGSVDDVPRAALLSEDGGVTWREVGRVGSRGFVSRFDDGELIVGSLESGTFKVLPSGEAVPQPTGSSHPPGPGGERVGFETELIPRLANDVSTFLSSRDAAGQPTAYFAFPGGSLRIGYAVSPTQLLGLAERNDKAALNTAGARELGGVRRLPVVIDLAAGTVSPIQGLAPSTDFGHLLPVLFQTGPFARVAADGDCLNVRESASTSAASLACYRDGVLLRDLGETVEAGGVTWLKVATPDGREGWANFEFLER